MESTQCESVGPFLCGERSWVVPCRDVRPTPPVFSHTARPRSGPSRAPSPRRYVSHGRREGGNAAARAGLGARGGSVEGGRGEGEPLGAARRWCRRPTWRHPAPIAGPGHASVPPTPLFLRGGAHWPPPAVRGGYDPKEIASWRAGRAPGRGRPCGPSGDARRPAAIRGHCAGAGPRPAARHWLLSRLLPWAGANNRRGGWGAHAVASRGPASSQRALPRPDRAALFCVWTGVGGRVRLLPLLDFGGEGGQRETGPPPNRARSGRMAALVVR